MSMIFSSLTAIQDAFDQKALSTLESMIVTPNREAISHPTPRSYLMVSAHQLKHLNKLDQLEADVAMINLEDGVAPELKPAARYAAALFISHLQKGHSEIIVRINPLQEGGYEDIALLNRVKPDGIRIPKVRYSAEVEQALVLIDSDIDVHLSIETKEALRSIDHFRIDPRVTTLYLGALDLYADMGLSHALITPDNPTTQALLVDFLITSHLHGFRPVGLTYQDYKNETQFEQWCYQLKTMGYQGMSCIAPNQVAIANRIFAPNHEEIKRAQAITAAFTEHAKEGCTGFVHPEYGFIDEPIYKGAMRLLKGL